MKGPIANPEALEHLETGERRSPPKSHMPSHSVPASVSHRNHRERGRTEFSWWCNVMLLEMPLVGHVAGYSIKIEEGDGIPAPAQGSVLQQWESSGRFCVVSLGPGLERSPETREPPRGCPF